MQKASSTHKFGDLYKQKGQAYYYILLVQRYARSRYWTAIRYKPGSEDESRTVSYFKPAYYMYEKVSA